jgi:glycosyltransferase involved in cell wall biosynthesis
MTNRKKISIVTPVYNEEDNIEELYNRIRNIMLKVNYDYEHICIDNCSTDTTAIKLKILASADKNLKIIINSRNFGYIRSSYHAILESSGDATILLASDLQDPPEIIPQFINQWESGYKSIFAVKKSSEESKTLYWIRNLYYKFITSISEAPLIKNATGAGMFDVEVVNILRKMDDPYPYFRGLICEIGFPVAEIKFDQIRRKKGKSSFNFYLMYDTAILAITKHSKIPLRMLSIGGFILSFVCIIIAISFIVVKILFWDLIQVGIAPILISIFFFGSIQAFFIGILGEYIISIHTHVRKLPHVIETCRINFNP